MEFRIDHAHPCLPGHFPGHPLVPGVVVLDRVIAAIEAAHGPLGATRWPQVKFVQPLLPDQAATVVLDGAAPHWKFRVLRVQDDAVLVSGEVIASPA